MINIHPIRCGLAYAFLIEQENGLFLVDSGSPGQEESVLNQMDQLGRSDLKLIWITHAHYDHYGSAAKLRDITGAKIGIHARDAHSLANGQSPLGSTRRYGFIYPPAQKLLQFVKPLPETPADFTVQGDTALESFGINATILHTPGHTPGHTCFCIDGTVIAGDLIGSFPKPGLQRLLATGWQQLPSSLKKVQSIHPDLVFAGHSETPIPGQEFMKISAH